MAFSRVEHRFSYSVTKSSSGNQPVIFKLDLQDLIVDTHSPIFTVDFASVTAYKQGTCERIPVKFAILNDDTKRTMTSDLFKTSSVWQVPGLQNAIPIGGTDTEPFKRTLTVYDKQFRQATLNILGFMMTESLGASRTIKNTWCDILNGGRSEFATSCERCAGHLSVIVTQGHEPKLILPICVDDKSICVPCTGVYNESRSIASLVRFLISATGDPCLNTAPLTSWRNAIAFPLASVNRFVSLYDKLSRTSDMFGVLDSRIQTVKLLVESPCDNIGLVSGTLGITLIHGASVADVYYALKDPVDEEDEEEEDEQDLLSLGMTDALIKHGPIPHDKRNIMTVREWCDYYYDRDA